jgi:hypothetical protein
MGFPDLNVTGAVWLLAQTFSNLNILKQRSVFFTFTRISTRNRAHLHYQISTNSDKMTLLPTDLGYVYTDIDEWIRGRETAYEKTLFCS